MHAPRIRSLGLWVCLIALTASAASAAPASVLTPATTSITVQSYASNGPRPDQTIDLVSHEISEADPAHPGTPRIHRTLDAAELAPVLAVLRGIANVDSPRPGEGGVPGGSTFWILRDKAGGSRILAEPEAAPTHARFVAITRAQWLALAEAWPDPRARRQPLSTEQKIKQFLTESLFGPPGGPRDLATSLARVDPDHKLFDLFDHIQSDTAVAYQLRLKPGVAISAVQLAHELEVAEPIAYLVNAEHYVWTLGDKQTGKPANRWRTAELDVRLSLPIKRGVHVDTISPIEGATVDSVFLILKQDFNSK